MAIELLTTIDGMELWGDPDIVKLSGYVSENGRNFFLTVELKTHYFIDPIKFTMKRDTRGDFNYNHITFSDYIQGVITEMVDGVERNIGVIDLNASLDDHTTKIEVIINPDNIVQYKEPEPDPEPEPEPEPEQIFGEGLTEIENGVYRNKGITGAITIADGVTTIGLGSFRNNQITSINLPESLESIKNRAFDDNKIISVVIPDSVTSIGSDVFRNNPLLEVSISSNTTYDSSSFPTSAIITVRVEPDPEPDPEPEPEPETVSLSVPDFEPNFNYSELVKEGKIDVLVNDVKLNIVLDEYSNRTLEKVEVIADDPLKVTILNNQLNNIFNLDEISFIDEIYDSIADERVELDRSPNIATADKLEWNINSSNWNRMIRYNRLDMLPYLYFIARPTEPTENYPFLKLYKISDDELKKLSTELINSNEDLTGYVNNLIRVPYPITSDTETVGIQVYNTGFNATGNLIDDYIQEIKLGKIKCTHEMLTGIGYKNIEFTLYVPYFKPISLEVPKVIDRDLDLILKLDLSNGQSTLSILIDGTTYLIENQKIAKDIPFRADNINISLDDTIYNNKFKYPYITVTVLNPDNTIDSKVLKQRQINKTMLSYVKSDKIYLNSKATYLEQLEIESLIRRGVFINGKN